MDENAELFKIITLGDSAVGKTSIIKRYANGIFEDECLSTVGVSFSFKEVTLKEGRKIKLKFIDTAGKEKYRAISKSYYKNAQGILFIFSYDNKDSFEHMQMWLNSCKDNISIKENIPIFLIGNKYDVENKQIQDN
jgi:small GTP-binding protein